MSDNLRKWYAGPGAAIPAIPAIEAEKPQKSADFQSQPRCYSLLLAASGEDEKPQKSAVSESQSQKSQIAAGGAGKNTGAESPWRDAYAERMALMVKDGGASEAEAHATAYQEALQAWFRASPLSAPQEGHCARCGFPVQPSDAGAYWYRDGPDVDPLPVHGKCVQLLQHERRAKAIAALAAAGIRETC